MAAGAHHCSDYLSATRQRRYIGRADGRHRKDRREPPAVTFSIAGVVRISLARTREYSSSDAEAFAVAGSAWPVRRSRRSERWRKLSRGFGKSAARR
jgi:hypothetical protein